MPAIIIVQFESPHLLRRQLPAIKEYLPGADIFVYDNSRLFCNQETNRGYCSSLPGVTYRSVMTDEKDFSLNHSRALNYAFIDLRHVYDVLLFLDHDVFPFAPCTILQQAEANSFVGFKQNVGNVTYLHPAVLAINTRLVNHVDFSPQPGLDTGGRMAHLINDANTKYIGYFKNEEIGYEILDSTFMHFVKGSNWTGDEGHKERLKTLFATYDNIISILRTS